MRRALRPRRRLRARACIWKAESAFGSSDFCLKCFQVAPIYDDTGAGLGHRIREVRIDVALDGSTGGVCHCFVVGLDSPVKRKRDRSFWKCEVRSSIVLQLHGQTSSSYLRSVTLIYMGIFLSNHLRAARQNNRLEATVHTHISSSSLVSTVSTDLIGARK